MEPLYHSQHSERTVTQILDALLFASQKALSLKEIISYFKAAATADPEGPAIRFANIKEMEVLVALQQLRDDLAVTGRSYELRETASGWQLMTSSRFAPWIRQLFPEAKPSRLSAPALETLAIIAYRQPITRADIEAVRGVAVDGVMQTILDRGLIRINGRADIPGRPLLYATTQSFLDHFGLRHLDELPNAAELRYVPLPTASSSDSEEAVETNSEASQQSPEKPSEVSEEAQESSTAHQES